MVKRKFLSIPTDFQTMYSTHVRPLPGYISQIQGWSEAAIYSIVYKGRPRNRFQTFPIRSTLKTLEKCYTSVFPCLCSADNCVLLSSYPLDSHTVVTKDETGGKCDFLVWVKTVRPRAKAFQFDRYGGWMHLSSSCCESSTVKIVPR